MTIHRDQVWEICKVVGAQKTVDPLLLLAINEQESEKAGRNSLLYRGDVARLEQGYYRRYTEKHDWATTTEALLAMSYGIPQMMGLSLYELGWFDREFKRQSLDYQARYIEPMSEENVPKALNRYCVNFSDQVQTEADHFLKKLKLAHGETHKALLFWNGGGNPKYPDEVLIRIPSLKLIYGTK